MLTPRRLGFLLYLTRLACEESVVTQSEWDRLAYPTLEPFASTAEWDQYLEDLSAAGPTVTAGCEPIHHTAMMAGDPCYVEEPAPSTDPIVLPHGDHFVVPAAAYEPLAGERCDHAAW